MSDLRALYKLIGVGMIAYATNRAVKSYARRVLTDNLEPEQFHGWWHKMDDDLLILLDAYQTALKSKSMIGFVSPNPRAAGRKTGSKNSQHYDDGVINAVDWMIKGADEERVTIEQLRAAYDLAILTGFTGIGVGRDWNPHRGLHLDNRKDRMPGNPATWAEIKLADGTQDNTRPVYEAFA